MKKTSQSIHYFLSLIGSVFLFSSNVIFADCSQSGVLQNVPIKFYSCSLSTYNINLTNTLSAIASGQADQDSSYYEKSWRGSCPGGLTGHSCREYTVYPNTANFIDLIHKNYPNNDIMQLIRNSECNPYSGSSNRGEVRILTNSSETYYVYTTNHEHTYCGPYKIPH